MKILLLGKNGQVGWELQRALAPLGAMVALDRAGADGLRGDLEDLEGLARTVRKLAPDVVVNAAAYTAVDKAETDVARAQCINAEAPGVLAQAAAEVRQRDGERFALEIAAGDVRAGTPLIIGNTAPATPTPFTVPRRESKRLDPAAAADAEAATPVVPQEPQARPEE